MKKILIAFTLFFLAIGTNFAQYTTVTFDEELVQLNSHEPLTTERDFMVTGNIASNIDFVEISIFTAKGKSHLSPLYTNTWRRTSNNTSTQYRVPMNYKLRAGKTYDMVIRYYKPLSASASEAMYQKVIDNLETYVDQNFKVKKKKLKLVKKSKQVIKELDAMVANELSKYQTLTPHTFNGFSDLIQGQVKLIERTRIKNANRQKDSIPTISSNLIEEQIIDLKNMLRAEVDFIPDNDWSNLHREYIVDNFETEKRNGYFAVNAGYGAVYLGGNIDKLSYGTSPYLGLSFPLSTSTTEPKFFGKASITAGVFTQNFEDKEANKISGPIVKRPMYLGLDYRLFQFIRFNAGASFLEEQTASKDPLAGVEKRVFVQPFIGLSAKINLSIGLDK